MDALHNKAPMKNVSRRTQSAEGISRRRFIYSSSATAVAVISGCCSPNDDPRRQPRANYRSPGEKLNIGCIGLGGKGVSDVAVCDDENIVALCDVDELKLKACAKDYPQAKCYRDYRRMLDVQTGLDAIVISTPDHHHAPAASRAIHLGKHVYCQKPLSHTVWEARHLAELAHRKGVATQMGNQGHSYEGNRRMCEMIWSGAIGTVQEVHCWTDRAGRWWPQGMDIPIDNDPVPLNLDWDLWLGPAPIRPFKSAWSNREPVYHPLAWRGWWDFGSGALGDMGCHIMDGPCWALNLSAPSAISVVESSARVESSPPTWAIIRYEFPARGSMPPVSLIWYEGGKLPAKPKEMEAAKLPDNGTLIVGTKGTILNNGYGTEPKLLPESRMKEYVFPPPQIPRIPDSNSHREWIRAC